MGVTLLYRAEAVGPVCQRLARKAEEQGLGRFRVICDEEDGAKVPGAIVRWGSTDIEWDAEKVINTAQAVRIAKNKELSRRLLGDLSPKTWTEQYQIQLPAVIRPRKHHAAGSFYVCRNYADIFAALKDKAIRRHGWYASELIDKAMEFRVFVLQGRVVAVSQRFPGNPGDVAWNLAAGGRLLNVDRDDWHIPALKASIQGCDRIGLDWAAVDVIVDKNDRPYVLEVNTAPGLRNKYTMARIAKALAWAGEYDAPGKAEGDSWKKLMHPSLRKKK